MSMERRLAPKIHARGDAAGLDAVLELVAFSARPRSLVVALDEMPAMIAAALRAQVCSIYLLEGDDLVMRGNVGFGPEAIGNVRLSVGEGVTGMAVEALRPISLQTASAHASWRHFPGLGEERFPIFLAVPVPGASRPLGALVLQRRDGPAFHGPEIELAAALTAPIAAMVERARLVDALEGRRGPGGAAGRRVTLSGRSIGPGQALGVVFNAPRPSRKDLKGPARAPGVETEQALAAAVLAARRALGSLEKRLREKGGAAALLASFRMILDDRRLRERALELAAQGRTLGEALQHVGSEAARAARRAGEAFGVDRAGRISEVCDALAYLSAQDRPAPPRKAVVACDALSAFDLLTSVGVAFPVAVVTAEPAAGSLRALLEHLHLPAVSEVSGLLRWATDGERALVDGDHGLVSLNPRRSE